MVKNNSVIIIETPEHIELQFQLAGIGKRSLAYAVDRLIQLGAILGVIVLFFLIVYFLDMVPYIADLFAEIEASSIKWIIGLVILLQGFISIGYFFLFEFFWSGSTPGKKTQGIRVINRSGRPVALLDSVLRNVLRFFDIIGGVYPIGLVVMFFNSRGLRMGDFAAGTLVIEDRRIKEPSLLDSSDAVDGYPTDSVRVASEMTPEDYRLLTKFLARREELDPEYREKIAMGVYSHLFEDAVNRRVSATRHEKSLEEVELLYRDRTRIL
ncbi:RDD family protein [Thermodesulfobacteriota bacterium]